MVNKFGEIMDELLPELKSFIENYVAINNFKNVDLSNLNLTTSLDLDLNLFDLDMDLFLTDFIETFNVDYTNFNWNNYGYPRGTLGVLLVRSFLNYKSSYVKRLAHFIYKPKICLYTLQQAIETGVLV